MPWQTEPPVSERVAFLPRTARRRRWPAALAIGTLIIVMLALIGPIAALLLHMAVILLSIALAAGLIAFAAFRIGIAPYLRARRMG